LVVKLPVGNGTLVPEGITEKKEIQKGVYLAGAMTKVQAGYTITSIANTNSEEVEIDEPVLEVTEIVQNGERYTREKGSHEKVNRAEAVLK
jgi:hypothetical protein